MTPKNKAVFLDRDGTIVVEKPYPLKNPQDVSLLSDVIPALKLLKENNFKTIIVTNQAAVAKGLITEEDVQNINNTIIRMIAENQAEITDIYYCPHFKGDTIQPLIDKYAVNCECRKPKPGLLLKAASDHNIDLVSSYTIGDMRRDLEAGLVAGTKAILILTGKGSQQDVSDLNIDYIASNLLDAVKYIIAQSGASL